MIKERRTFWRGKKGSRLAKRKGQEGWECIGEGTDSLLSPEQAGSGLRTERLLSMQNILDFTLQHCRRWDEDVPSKAAVPAK